MHSRKRPRNGPAGLRAGVLLVAFSALLAAGAQAQTTLPVGGAGHAGRIDAAGEVDRFEVPWVEHTHAYSKLLKEQSVQATTFPGLMRSMMSTSARSKTSAVARGGPKR